MILDTTFLIDLLKNDPAAVKKARELERGKTSLATTAITVFELWRGFSALQEKKMERACRMLDSLKVYPFDEIAARRGGRIAHALDRAGQTIDPEDAMIAGTAMEKREEILTRNVAHFKRIPNLAVNGD